MVTQADLPAPPTEGFAWFEFEGERYKLFADGALRKPNGHFVLRHPASGAAIRARAVAAGVASVSEADSASQGALLAGLKAVKVIASKRQAEQESQEGLLRAAKLHGPGSPKVPAEAWGAVVQAQAKIAFAGGRESTGAARFVGEATRFMVGKESAGSQSVQVQVIIGSELANRYAPDEGEVVDEVARLVPEPEAET